MIMRGIQKKKKEEGDPHYECWIFSILRSKAVQLLYQGRQMAKTQSHEKQEEDRGEYVLHKRSQ